MGERIRTFRDVRAWQEARKLARLIGQAIAGNVFNRHWALRDQMLKSAVSSMANIAEGYGRGNDNEFALFLRYAIGSIRETQSHADLALDLGLLSEEGHRAIDQQAESAALAAIGFLRYLRGEKE